MSDRGTADQDPIRLWLESSRAFFESETLPDSLRDHCAALFAAWTRFARVYAEASGAGVTAGGPFDPIGWIDAAGDGGFGDLWRWFGADPWREEGELLRGSREWLAYGAALERYRAVLGAGWLKAFQRFAGALAERKKAPSWKAIQRLWQAAADAELDAAQRSEAFLAAQRDVIRARLDLAALLRARAERTAALLGLPTRAEIDELQERVHALGRELRAGRDPRP